MMGAAPDDLDTGDWDGMTGFAMKPYFIGVNGDALQLPDDALLPTFEWHEPQSDGLLTTPLYDLHVKLGAKMVEFAGYDMPVYYSSVSDEHLAVRNRAGVFDVSHMGTFDASGAGSTFRRSIARSKPGCAFTSSVSFSNRST
jgi:hypothetical protein